MTDKPETWNVHHFVNETPHKYDDDDPSPPCEYGVLEIEEMHEKVNVAWEDLKGGDTTADPVAAAESYRKRVEGVPAMERRIKKLVGVLSLILAFKRTCYFGHERDAAYNRAARLIGEEGLPDRAPRLGEK